MDGLAVLMIPLTTAIISAMVAVVLIVRYNPAPAKGVTSRGSKAAASNGAMWRDETVTFFDTLPIESVNVKLDADSQAKYEDQYSSTVTDKPLA